ncbi:hypothetical protein FACS189496_3720 [Bacilli bacterium]|nr:hypothetical protein FACS189496_3720 [Bacilli bacterium]
MIDISSQTTINTIVKTHKFYNDEGIFYLSDEKAVCSYPEEGNNQCFQIEDDSFWFKHRNKIIETVVNNYSQKNSVFFDVGGGQWICLGYA